MRYHEYLHSKMKPAIPLIILASLVVTLFLAACGDVTPTTGPAAPVTNTAAPITLPPTTASTTTASQTKSTTPQSPAATPGAAGPVSLGQPFYLKAGESASLSNPSLTIKFVRVSEDSRCPAANGEKMVACAWAGQVSAELEVKQGNNQTETLTLTLPGATSLKTIPSSATKNFGNNQLQLLKVEPHPIVDQQINPADYTATLQIIPAPAQTAPASPTPKPTTSLPTTGTSPTTTGPTAQPFPSPNMDATPVPIVQGQPFQLKMNQTAFLPTGNLYVTFLRISEDSRCPDANPKTGKSVACFWAGQVTANIEVRETGQASQTVKLTLPGSVNINTTSKAKIGNYQIEVKQILPRAIIDIEINPADYVVTLVVS